MPGHPRSSRYQAWPGAGPAGVRLPLPAEWNGLFYCPSSTDGVSGFEAPFREYRHGNDKENNVRKLIGLNKAADITLKRGILGTEPLFKWLDAIRKGAGDRRTVKITLLNEGRDPGMTWVLNNASATKLNFGPLNAKGSDVAMEELVLAYERLQLA